MKTIHALFAGPLLSLCVMASGAHAAQTAHTVSSCASITYPADQDYPITQDTTGKLCTGATVTPGGTQDVNTKQVNGVTVLTGTGATGTGAQRVTVSTDTATIAGSASGTAGTPSANVLTVQGATSMTPLLVTSAAATSGGLSTYSGNVTTAGSGAGTGGVAVDVSAGQLYSYQIWNGNSSVCYIQFFDQTQALTNLGTTVPKKSIGIPALGGANLAIPQGIPFATAITIGVTTTRSGSTACSTGLDINLDYK